MGLFADGTYGNGWNGVAGNIAGLSYGDASQFVAEFIGVASDFIITGMLAYGLFKLSTYVTKMRVDPKVEMCGLDNAVVKILGDASISISRDNLAVLLKKAYSASGPAALQRADRGRE